MKCPSLSTSVVVRDRLGKGLVCCLLPLPLGLLSLVMVTVLGDHPHHHHDQHQQHHYPHHLELESVEERRKNGKEGKQKLIKRYNVKYVLSGSVTILAKP